MAELRGILAEKASEEQLLHYMELYTSAQGELAARMAEYHVASRQPHLRRRLVAKTKATKEKARLAAEGAASSVRETRFMEGVHTLEAFKGVLKSSTYWVSASVPQGPWVEWYSVFSRVRVCSCI